MTTIIRFKRFVIVTVAVLSWATASAASDRAIVRGRLTAIDPVKHQIEVQTSGGEQLTLFADSASKLTKEGKPATLGDYVLGQRVRMMYEKVKEGSNRVVTLQSAVPTKADLSNQVNETLKSAREYTFAQKEQYEEKLRNLIDDVDDRLEDLKIQAKDAGADAKSKLNSSIQDMQQKRDELSRWLEKAKPAAADAWEDVKAGVSSAADELSKALGRMQGEAK